MIGQTILHYRIVEKLGEGGMGAVYKAEDTQLRRTVALKFLTQQGLSDPETKARLIREAQAAASLDHPNICGVHGFHEEGGQTFIAMAYVDGASLAEKIKQRPLALEEACDTAIQIGEGLQEAHDQGVVHRDIKPANVMLTRKGRVKITDFGLAYLAGRSKLTRSGTTMGTPVYMSPEQALGQAADRRSDIWALGVVLYEMIAGKPPFESEYAQAIVYSIINEPPEPLTARRAGLPPEIDRVIGKALAKDPAQRYQHLDDMLVDLRALQRIPASSRVTASTKPVAATALTKRWKVMVPAGAAVVASFVAAYFYLHRAPTLTDRDTIVLADFSNTTGDAVFDGTLRQGLAIQLAQSPFLSLVSEQRIQEVLRLMGQPPDARLTPEIAQEVCERAGSAAVLDGSIASLGSQYVLGLRATDCRSGAVLDEQQAQAARKEDVLTALSQIASTFRTRVGESLATVERYSTPLAETTTSSLEALKAYSTGMTVTLSGGGAASVPFFRRAVEIDPTFAMAHAHLGFAYGYRGESVLSAESTTKAWLLRDRVSDREKFYIDVTYDRLVTGNLEKAYQTLELWSQTYPRAGETANAQDLLGGLPTQGTGRFERAIEAALEGIAADPDLPHPYANLARAYFFTDRFPEAESTLQRASARKLEMPDLLVLRYDIAVLKGDQEQMDRIAGSASGNRAAGHWIAHGEALALARSGRLQAARRSSSRAVDLALQEGQREMAARYRAARGVWEAFCGNTAEGKSSAMAALELSKGRDVQYAAGLALALSGDSPRSEALAGDLEKRFPESTFVKFTYAPVLGALAALGRSNPADSVERLQIALPYELAVNGLNYPRFYLGGLHSAYVRGEALIGAHRYAEAAAEFQKVLDHRGIVALDPIGALAHLQLGRAFALSGDKTKAQTAYQDFLTLWKDADPGIPILEQAKAEFAKLQ